MEEKNINDIIIIGHIAIFLYYRVPYLSCCRADNRVTNTKYYYINIYIGHRYDYITIYYYILL